MPTGTKTIYSLTADTHPAATDLLPKDNSTGTATRKSTVSELNSAPPLVFADATARDVYFTSPTNGNRCYVTALNTTQTYKNGAWTNDATGISYTGTSPIDITAGAVS